MSPNRSGFTAFLLASAFLLLWSAIVNAAIVPISQNGDPKSLFKRAVSYGDTGNPAAASSICNDEQKAILERSMTETVNVTKAGSNGLAIILDMLTEEKTEYKKLTLSERERYRKTFFTFFGRIKNKEQFADFRTRATSIKTSLDLVVPLTVESWPPSITFFCDSTYLQDTDPDENTWDKVPTLTKLKDTREWKYDYDQKRWVDIYKTAKCVPEVELGGFTLPFNEQGKDRTTFCPNWFTATQKEDVGKTITDLNPETDIKVGTKLYDFRRKSVRVFFHEHLHTYYFNNKITDNNVKLNDVEKAASYGIDNTMRLALKDPNLASRNIENVVYYCIAMYYNTWNWSTGVAAIPSVTEPPTKGSDNGNADAPTTAGGDNDIVDAPTTEGT